MCDFLGSDGSSCQFTNRQNEVQEVQRNGQTWCLAHLPLVEADGKLSGDPFWDDANSGRLESFIRDHTPREIAASPQLELHGVVFPNAQGSNALTNLRTKGVIFHECCFLNVTFQQVPLSSVLFRNCMLAGTFRFESMHNTGNVAIEGGRISANCSISGHSRRFRISSLPHICEGQIQFHNLETGGLTLESTVFAESVSISGTVRMDPVTISKCRFVSGFNVSGLRPRRGLIIASTTFLAGFDASWPEPHDSSSAMDTDIRATVFRNSTKFSRRIFPNQCLFGRDVTFDKAPQFFECEFNGTVQFPERSSFHGFEEGSAAAYRHLKHTMEGMRARHEEGLFNALEQEARRRNLQIATMDRVVATFYAYTSNYGTSLTRPIAWFGIFFFTFWFLSVVVFTPPNSHAPYYDGQDWIRALQFVLLQTVRPFSALFASALLKALDPLIELRKAVICGLISAVYSLLILALVGEFLVALRWKFRRS